jgi:hypothetical protein
MGATQEPGNAVVAQYVRQPVNPAMDHTLVPPMLPMGATREPGNAVAAQYVRQPVNLAVDYTIVPPIFGLGARQESGTAVVAQDVRQPINLVAARKPVTRCLLVHAVAKLEPAQDMILLAARFVHSTQVLLPAFPRFKHAVAAAMEGPRAIAGRPANVGRLEEIPRMNSTVTRRGTAVLPRTAIVLRRLRNARAQLLAQGAKAMQENVCTAHPIRRVVAQTVRQIAAGDGWANKISRQGEDHTKETQKNKGGP